MFDLYNQIRETGNSKRTITALFNGVTHTFDRPVNQVHRTCELLVECGYTDISVAKAS